MNGPPPEHAKNQMRAAILRRRRTLSPDERQSDAQRLLRHLSHVVPTSEMTGPTVCAYVPIGSEPGAPEMLDVLVEMGLRVLLPVTRVGEPLCWGDYRQGGLIDAAFGLREPAGPWLGPEAIGSAQLILVPALAVDRSGVRLGRGAGFYDRSLHLAAADARLVAVVRDDELVERLPAEAHDVPMTHALTPGAGLVALNV